MAKYFWANGSTLTKEVAMSVNSKLSQNVETSRKYQLLKGVQISIKLKLNRHNIWSRKCFFLCLCDTLKSTNCLHISAGNFNCVQSTYLDTKSHASCNADYDTGLKELKDLDLEDIFRK